jgi:hypothetical protein
MIVWKIDSLKVVQQPQPNTVTEVAYSAIHSDGSARSGVVRLRPPKETFVAYSNLTETNVLRWLWEFVNKDATEELLTTQAGHVEAKALPWSA